ncbi:MAG TPA: sortase [Candidatus Saccharimonadales bacterium]|nr:sortase [Candidatus Saccharimonadales bacterium]
MNLTKLKHHYFNTIPNLLVLGGIVFLFLAYGPLIRDEIWYKFEQIKGQKYVVGKNSDQTSTSIFGSLLSTSPVILTPVNTDFSIIIEKIGVDVPIVADVPVTDEKAYNEALKRGVAHASVSQYPSEDAGNVYLFAHASINFWSLGQYATVFNLLGKLELKDRVHVFFKNKDYVYEVVNKEVLKGWNTYPLTRPVIEPTLTLQTCDPPGTTLNRLIVTSKLVEVKDLSDSNGI